MYGRPASESGCSYSRGQNLCYLDTRSPYIHSKCQLVSTPGNSGGSSNFCLLRGENETSLGYRVPGFYSLPDPGFYTAKRPSLYSMLGGRLESAGSFAPAPGSVKIEGPVYLSGPVGATLAVSGEHKILILGDRHDMEDLCPQTPPWRRDRGQEEWRLMKGQTSNNEKTNSETTWDVTTFLHLFFLSEGSKDRNVDFFLEEFFPRDGLFLDAKELPPFSDNLEKVTSYFLDYFSKKDFMPNVHFHYTDLRYWSDGEGAKINTPNNILLTLSLARIARGDDSAEALEEAINFARCFYQQEYWLPFPLARGQEREEIRPTTLHKQLILSIIFSSDFSSDLEQIKKIMREEGVPEETIEEFSRGFVDSPHFIKRGEGEDPASTRIERQNYKLSRSEKCFAWAGISRGRNMAREISAFLLRKVEEVFARAREKISAHVGNFTRLFLDQGVRGPAKTERLLKIADSVYYENIMSNAIILDAYYIPRMFLHYPEFPAQSKAVYAGDKHGSYLAEFLSGLYKKQERRLVTEAEIVRVTYQKYTVGEKMGSRLRRESERIRQDNWMVDLLVRQDGKESKCNQINTKLLF